MSFARWLGVLLLLVVATFATDDADARRIASGGRAGMQRTLPPKPATTPGAAPNAGPAAPTAPAATASPAVPPTAAAPAPAQRRSWLGPLAGLAAGLGLAALMGHLGFGAEFGSLLLTALLAIAALFVVRAFVRRSSPVPAYAGGAPRPSPPFGPGAGPSPVTPTLTLTAATDAPETARPDGFDVPGFAHTARQIFVRMQAANDAARLAELQAFTTPELYASLRDDVAARGDRPQRTDVVRIDADVLDVATEGPQQVVSVRFQGLVREGDAAVAEPFDEVWHLVRPLDGSRPWAIAGIQQTA